LREWLEVTDVRDGRVEFDAHNVFPDGHDRVYTSVLYYRDAEAVRHALERAGFSTIAWAGDWHGTPVSAESRLLVFRVTR
jgi:hypothetical protein